MQTNRTTTTPRAPLSMEMNRGEDERRSNPIAKVINSAASGAACSAIGVATTAMPTAGNCLNGTVTPGMLGKAVGYGAAAGAITGVTSGLAAISGGAVGACAAGSITACTGAEPETIATASALGCTAGATCAVIPLLVAPGYIAKTLAPSAFTGNAVDTGLNVLGGECVALGLGAAGTVGCGVMTAGPTIAATGVESLRDRWSEISAPRSENMDDRNMPTSETNENSE